MISGGPTPPRAVPVSTAEVTNLSETVQAAKPDATTGNIRITVTEAQVTSYVVENLHGNYESFLSNPVILFQPDQVELYGTLVSDGFSANGRVILAVTIDPQGKPLITIREANFGPIPVPASLLGNLSLAIDKSISDAMKNNQANFKLQSINFAVGTATVVFTRK
jgi:hypothetical protein